MPNYTQKTADFVLDIIFPKKCLGCNKFTSSLRSQHNPNLRIYPNAANNYLNADFDYVCRRCFKNISFKNVFECIGCKRQTRLGFTCTFCDKVASEKRNLGLWPRVSECAHPNGVDPVRGNPTKRDAGHAFQAGRTSNGVDQLIITAELSDPLVEKMLKAYKYKFIKSMAIPLSVLAKRRVKKLLSKGFSLFGDNPLLIPVPLHKRRLNERGFNQAELLAQSMADTYHVVCNSDILVRIANPKHQAEIKIKSDRINNVKNNFALKDGESIRGRTVILVDDICTTGATLNECARVLKNPPTGGGAKRVIGFVIARGTTEARNKRETRNKG